ncbi:MAG: hypothetical protein FWD88_03915 [Treponema sp.]|nr:hypothetical protein [Treponema sp.]
MDENKIENQFQKSLFLLDKGNTDEARIILSEILEISKKTNNQLFYIRTNTVLADLNFQEGNLEMAEKYSLNVTNTQIQFEEEWDDALNDEYDIYKNIIKEIKIKKLLNKNENQIYDQLNSSLLLMDDGKMDEARIVLNKLLEMAEENDNKYFYIGVNTLFGKLNFDEGKFEIAEKHFLNAVNTPVNASVSELLDDEIDFCNARLNDIKRINKKLNKVRGKKC